VFDQAADSHKTEDGRQMRGYQSFSPAAASFGRSNGSPPHCGCSGWAAPGSVSPALGPGRSGDKRNKVSVAVAGADQVMTEDCHIQLSQSVSYAMNK